MTEITIDQFTNSYLQTAHWARFDSGEASRGFSNAAKQVAKQDCQLFIDKVRKEFTENEASSILNLEGNDLTSLTAHDFFLTRDGHGSGFWDKEIYNEIAKDGGERLTKLSKECRESGIYSSRGYAKF
jgi:hypothetical protein